MRGNDSGQVRPPLRHTQSQPALRAVPVDGIFLGSIRHRWALEMTSSCSMPKIFQNFQHVFNNG